MYNVSVFDTVTGDDVKDLEVFDDQANAQEYFWDLVASYKGDGWHQEAETEDGGTIFLTSDSGHRVAIDVWAFEAEDSEVEDFYGKGNDNNAPNDLEHAES